MAYSRTSSPRAVSASDQPLWTSATEKFGVTALDEQPASARASPPSGGRCRPLRNSVPALPLTAARIDARLTVPGTTTGNYVGVLFGVLMACRAVRHVSRVVTAVPHCVVG